MCDVKRTKLIKNFEVKRAIHNYKLLRYSWEGGGGGGGGGGWGVGGGGGGGGVE